MSNLNLTTQQNVKTITLSVLQQKLLTHFLNQLEENYSNAGCCQFDVHFLTKAEQSELASK